MTAGSLAAPAALNGDGGGSAPAHVQLGEHNYPVYPQRIGRIENRIGRWLNDLVKTQVSGDTAGLVDMLGANVYDVLAVFIPRLMPLYEFRGYGSQDEFDRRDYDESKDASPSVPEIREAFATVLRVNAFDLFAHLGKVRAVIDTEFLKALLTARVAAVLDSGPSLTESATTTPPTTSTPSGTTPPTSTESAD